MHFYSGTCPESAWQSGPAGDGSSVCVRTEPDFRLKPLIKKSCCGRSLRHTGCGCGGCGCNHFALSFLLRVLYFPSVFRSFVPYDGDLSLLCVIRCVCFFIFCFDEFDWVIWLDFNFDRYFMYWFHKYILKVLKYQCIYVLKKNLIKYLICSIIFFSI